MRFLLDTNVISELRKNKPHGAVLQWFQSTPDDYLAISAIVIAEMQAGAEKTRLQDPAKCREIERFIDEIMQTMQVLSLDGRIMRDWAKLMIGVPNELSEDAMIAATALAYNLVVVTRNTRDLGRFKVQVHDPFLPK